MFHSAWVTLYHPEPPECPDSSNITSTGDSGRIGTCAVTQHMLNWHCNYGDSIKVFSGSLKGTYLINDLAGGSSHCIDIWRPRGDTLMDCYKSKFKTINNGPI